MIRIALLGSTGSIGRQVLSTVARYPDKFSVVSLAAGSNAALLKEQAEKFRPSVCCLTDPSKACGLSDFPRGVSLYTGPNAPMHAITEDCDIVFAAMSGFAGLAPVLEGISLGKTIALANKETLVAGGDLVMKRAEEKGVKIVPVDSEHSAIFQCLNFDRKAPFRNLIITASGGAFRNFSREEIAGKKAAEALKHPNWTMGAKITIDCATMLNKGLEVIEACHLYGAPLEKVRAVVHPESIVHSMVEFDDGAVMAQLGFPSMELPIQLALTYPERLPTGIPPLDLMEKTLHFDPIDEEKYPCFPLALRSFRMGDNFPCAMNAANEVAVGLYLKDEISFYDIPELIGFAIGKTTREKVTDERVLTETDAAARAYALEKIRTLR